MIHNHEVPSSILGPATWKSSTYEIFVSAFFLPVNTAWTPNLFISFSFHYFHRWLVGCSEAGFYIWISILSEICGIYCSKLPLSSLCIFMFGIELPPHLYFHAILGSVNTAVNTEALLFLWIIYHSLGKTWRSVDIFVSRWKYLLEVFLWFSFAL